MNGLYASELVHSLKSILILLINSLSYGTLWFVLSLEDVIADIFLLGPFNAANFGVFH